MEPRYLFGIDDEGRTAGMVSYFFIIGWSIGYFGFHQPNKNSLSSFHLRQSLMLYLAFIFIWFGVNVFCHLLAINPGVIVTVTRLTATAAFLLLWLTGLKSATNAEEKPIPLFGKASQKLFQFI